MSLGKTAKTNALNRTKYGNAPKDRKVDAQRLQARTTGLANVER